MFKNKKLLIKVFIKKNKLFKMRIKLIMSKN